MGATESEWSSLWCKTLATIFSATILQPREMFSVVFTNSGLRIQADSLAAPRSSRADGSVMFWWFGDVFCVCPQRSCRHSYFWGFWGRASDGYCSWQRRSMRTRGLWTCKCECLSLIFRNWCFFLGFGLLHSRVLFLSIVSVVCFYCCLAFCVVFGLFNFCVVSVTAVTN